MTTNNIKPHLLSLPAELRDEIYQLTIPSDQHGCVNEVPVLTKVCRQARKEISKWIKARVRNDGVVLNYSTCSLFMDDKSLKLLRFCMQFTLNKQPLFNSVKQFQVNFGWLQNATGANGRPKFCRYRVSFSSSPDIRSTARCGGPRSGRVHCFCNNSDIKVHYRRFTDMMVFAFSVRDVFELVSAGADELMVAAGYAVSEEDRRDAERNAVCPSTWFSAPHAYTKPSMQIRPW